MKQLSFTNENLNTAATDLIEAIKGITLGSIEYSVIDGAIDELIYNWNDHNDDKIDEAVEVMNWAKMLQNGILD